MVDIVGGFAIHEYSLTERTGGGTVLISKIVLAFTEEALVILFDSGVYVGPLLLEISNGNICP